MKIQNDWDNITPSLWNSATNGEYLSDALSDASDSVNEFEETIDWIEIRMEELDESLGLFNAHLENAGSYIDKNKIVDEMIEVNGQIYKNATEGAKYYQNYANQYLKGMSKELAAAAKDGSIAISEFTKEQDEATVEAIKKYRESTQKASDLTQKAIETMTEIRDLYIQKIDNTQEYGSAKVSIENSQTEKLQNAVDFDEERGIITDASYYAAMMENSERSIAYLTETKKDMQKTFNEALKNGMFTNDDGTYNYDFYENLEKLYSIDSEIAGARKELEEFQNAINDIYWENFEQLISQYDYLSEETESLIELMSSDDLVYKPDNEKGWGENDVTWTDEGLATLGLHAQEMARCEEKAKDYGKAIDDLKREYKQGHYSESEYLEKLNELTQGQYDAIKAAQDEKDAIVDLNKERVDAIKDGINKQIEAYEELIDKKKEELQTEKDLYDFQKQSKESSKNIADIQRKLAALANDNSASAIAKRKQLEADLAEAREDQEELYYERSMQNQQDALDNELESFREQQEAKIEELEKWLENVEVVVTESLGIVRDEASEIGATLTNKAEEYNLTLSSAILDPWKKGALAVDEYTSRFGDNSSVNATVNALDSIRSKWEEITKQIRDANSEADKYYNKSAATADGKTVAEINKENKNYYSGTSKTAATTTTQTNKNNSSSSKSSTTTSKPSLTVGSYVQVKSGAKWYSDSSGGGSWGYASGGKIAYINEKGSHAYNIDGKGWLRKQDIQGYAKGTTGLKKDQLAFIDEMGLEEIVMHAGPDGRLQYLTKGTSVIPNAISENLMELGQLDPSEVLNRSRPSIIPSKSIINNNMEINVNASVGTLLNVEHLDGSNPAEVAKIVDKAWDKKVQGLNNAIRKFSR